MKKRVAAVPPDDEADFAGRSAWIDSLTPAQRRHLPRCDVDRCHRCPLLGGEWMPGCMSRAHNPETCSCPQRTRFKAKDEAILAGALAVALWDGRAGWEALSLEERRRAEVLYWQLLRRV